MKEKLISIAFLVLFILFFYAMPQKVESVVVNVKTILPPGSSDVKTIGNGWLTFKWKRNTFLAYRPSDNVITCLEKLD